MKHSTLLAADVAESPSWYCLRVAPRSLILSKRERMELVNGAKTWVTEYVFPAEEALAQRGFRPFVPTEGAWRRRSRYYRAKDRQRVRRPLLTGYILIDPPEPANWLRIMSLDFVQGVIVRNGRPARIAKDEPRRMDRNGEIIEVPRDIPRGLGPILAKHTEQAPEIQYHMPTGRTFNVGDRVELFDERFRGMPLTVKEIDGDRTRVLTVLFGADYEMSVDTWKLAKLAE